MPPVDVAMARSLHGGLWETMRYTLARSIAAELLRRDMLSDASEQVDEIQTAFSSWDNCMSYAFCKWPVFAVIAIGGIIIIGILICIIRCACCGLACCCSCFHCLKCCGNCCGCCDPPGAQPHKYVDEPYKPPQQQGYGYRQQAPMEAHFPPAPSGPFESQSQFQSQSHVPPQYAEFDVSKPDEPDALPRMPSWEGSNSKKVMLEEEGLEMDDLKKKAPSPDQRTSPMPGPMPGPIPGAAAPMPNGRNGPYNNHPPQGNSAGYMDAYVQQPPNVYGGPGQGRDYNYNRGPDAYGFEQPYDAAASASISPMGPGRQSPAQAHNGYGPAAASQMGPRQMSPAQTYAHPDNGYGAEQAHMDNGGYGSAQAHTQLDNGYGAGYGHMQTEYGYGSPQAHMPADHGYGSGQAHTQSDLGYGSGQMGQEHARMPSPPQELDGGYHVGSAQAPHGQADNGYGQGPAQMPSVPHELDTQSHFSPTSSSSPAPYGMDPRMRNSPGPSQSPIRPPGPPDGHGDAPSRLNSPRPIPYRTYTPAPQSAQASITNNSGFDFNSGYSRPQNDSPNHVSESQQPDSPGGYPGYKPYQAGQQGWS